VELTVTDGMLHIQAQRREEEKLEERGFMRRELLREPGAHAAAARRCGRVRHQGELQGRHPRDPHSYVQGRREAGEHRDPDQARLTGMESRPRLR
jgi:hypothetical protein